MKRFYYMFLVIMGLILLGCSNSTNHEMTPTEYDTVNTLEGLTTSADAASTTSVIVWFDNQTEESMLIGEAFTLEANQDGNWYQVPIVIEEEYAFTSVGYDIPPNQMTEWTVDWEWLYGEVDAGEYRIIQEVLDVKEPGNYDQYWIATTFRIE